MSGAATLSPTVSAGSGWNRWKTKPIVRRNAARSRRKSAVTSRSPTRIVPASARSIAPITWSSVDFPEPDGPVTATTCPGSTESVTSSIVALFVVLTWTEDEDELN